MAARDTALRLISKHGRSDGALRRPSADAIATPDRPWAPQDVSQGQDPLVARDLSVVVMDIETFRKMLGPDSAIAPQATAGALIAAASGAQPRVNDLLETRGSRYMVLSSQLLAPGEDDILYTLQLRG